MEGNEIKAARPAPPRPSPSIPHRPAPTEVPPLTTAHSTHFNGVAPPIPPIPGRKPRAPGPAPPPRVDLGESAEGSLTSSSERMSSNGVINKEAAKIGPKGRPEITIVSARPMGPSGVILPPSVPGQPTPANEEPKVSLRASQKAKGREPPPRPKSRPVSELTLEGGECRRGLVTGEVADSQVISEKEHKVGHGTESGLNKSSVLSERNAESHKVDSNFDLRGPRPGVGVDSVTETALKETVATKDAAVTRKKAKPSVITADGSNKNAAPAQEADEKIKNGVANNDNEAIQGGKPHPPAKKPKPALKPKPSSSINTHNNKVEETRSDNEEPVARKPKLRPTVILPSKPPPAVTEVPKPPVNEAEAVKDMIDENDQVKRSKPTVILPVKPKKTETPKDVERFGQVKPSKPTIILPDKPKNTKALSVTEKDERHGQTKPSTPTVIAAAKPPQMTGTLEGDQTPAATSSSVQGEDTDKERVVAKPRRVPTIIRASRPEVQDAGEGRKPPKRPQRGPSVRKPAPPRPVRAAGEQQDKLTSRKQDESDDDLPSPSVERKVERLTPPRMVSTTESKEKENWTEARKLQKESSEQDEISLKRRTSKRGPPPTRPPAVESVREGVKPILEARGETEAQDNKRKGKNKPPRPPSKVSDSQSSKDTPDQSDNRLKPTIPAPITPKFDVEKEGETSEKRDSEALKDENKMSRKGSRKRPPPPRLQKADGLNSNETETGTARDTPNEDHVKGTSESRDTGVHENAASKSKLKPARPAPSSISSDGMPPHRPTAPTTKQHENVKQEAASVQVSAVSETYIEPSAIALYDYEPTAIDDLSFNAGDEVVLVKKVDNDWYVGRVGEQQGMFPIKFVEIIEDLPDEVTQDAQPTKTSSSSPFDVIALYDFQGNKNDGELVFTAGEMIHVTEKINEDWLKGEVYGQSGSFPCNFVDISADTINTLPRSKSKGSTADSVDHAPEDAKHVVFCKAIYDYSSDVADDLKFSKGDVIQVCKRIGDEWMEGKLHGQVGLFPVAYVEMIEDTLPDQPESAMAAANSVEVGTAQYDFTGSAPDELSFVKGDKIQVTEVISDEWLRGKLDGREGMFPRTFVELSQQTVTESAGKNDKLTAKAKALFDFDGEFEDELSFKTDSVIVLRERVNEEWFKGELNGKVGRFPASFVQILTPLS